MGKKCDCNLPFESIHKQIVIHLIYFVVLWLNDFPDPKVISEDHPLDKFSPAERSILINTAK